MKRVLDSLLFLDGPPPAVCVAQTAQITGVVRDASDAAIPNARIVATNVGTEGLELAGQL